MKENAPAEANMTMPIKFIEEYLTKRCIKLVAGLVLISALWAASSLSPEIITPDRAICRVKTSKRIVALTYDDGPHPIYTPQILRILDEHNIKATFFMIGNRMEQYPGIVKAAIKSGHVIANHTYTHPRFFYCDSYEAMSSEIDKCEETLKKLGATRNYLFRPPRGLMNASAFAIVKKKGYTTVLWSVCGDHHDAPTPKLMADRVLKAVSPGCIILLHDGSFDSRWKDVAATKLIIDALQKKHYHFVTLLQLLATQQ